MDYDKEYFNTCMGYMSNNSTSARAFSQMLHRVRNLKEDNILIYIGDLYYSENTIKKEYKYDKNEYKPLKRNYNLREIYNILMMK